mmetsp:Transcript_13740/g.21760  ORF Transcript_13740/g.21760 Transcript_13740/m.21760 type:complete len:298 (+) Transcript_13740:26-919(+)
MAERMEQMETSDERDGFVSSQKESWLNAPCIANGRLRRAEVFIALQFFTILILFIVAISAGASSGSTLSMCAETFVLVAPPSTDDGIFALPTLPYGVGDLEPHIDENTMRFHYYKHFNGYRTNLNSATSISNLTEIQLTAMSGDAKVRNNGGGFYNHGLFFSTLCHAAQSGHPSNALAAAIDLSFGSYQQFWAAFSSAASSRFGSGWVWLSCDAQGKLKITTTPNQDNPLMTMSSFAGTPLLFPFLGLDVWEHSYYLKYQNRRSDFVTEWEKVINWKQVSRYYERFASQQLAVEWWR